MTHIRSLGFVSCLLVVGLVIGRAEPVLRHPFVGVTHVTRTETSPRSLRMHVVSIDLAAPGIRLKVTPPGGPRETIRQTTLQFLQEERAQVAINAHFFLPFPSANPFASLIGLAASDGVAYSDFESPEQSYALLTNAPALNIDAKNRASIVTATAVRARQVSLWNAVSGSAQIVTAGVKTIPTYRDAEHPAGELTPGGPSDYSNRNSWYGQLNARSAIGLADRSRTLILFTVDRAGGSLGMSVAEVADLLIRDYRVTEAINLDGGGSTTLAMQDSVTGDYAIVNMPSDNPAGRPVGSSLAVFARPRR